MGRALWLKALAIEGTDKRRLYAMLHSGGIKSLIDAVRAAIVQFVRGPQNVRIQITQCDHPVLAGENDDNQPLDCLRRSNICCRGIWIFGPTPELSYGNCGDLRILSILFGNWKLLKQSLEINIIIQNDVRDAIGGDRDNRFKSSIELLVANANPLWVSRTIHLFIDLCVIVSIWSRVSGCAAKLFGI